MRGDVMLTIKPITYSPNAAGPLPVLDIYCASQQEREWLKGCEAIREATDAARKADQEFTDAGHSYDQKRMAREQARDARDAAWTAFEKLMSDGPART